MFGFLRRARERRQARRRTREQVRWGLDYIRNQYGNHAAAHEVKDNWYSKGGPL